MFQKGLVIILFLVNIMSAQTTWIRVNQLGYLNKSIKVAVLISKDKINPTYFEICDALTDKSVWQGQTIKNYGSYGNFISSYRLDFSSFQDDGAYYVRYGEVKSPNFRIANDVYDGTADFLLKYMRHQQSGYNPFLKDSCHTHDGYIIYHPKLEMTHMDAVGGWHDATDYLQYVTTSANAVFQLLFAYQQNPKSFKDLYDKNGDPGANGIPDILDQAKWGLDWLCKMNPTPNLMFNQLADDRDHKGFRLPNKDTASYGKGLERPVYFCSGEPQGVFQYKNRTTGIASTAGKYASAFAFGSRVLKKYYPEFAEQIKKKAVDAYELGKKYPGVCQTAPCTSPYFYEEDNFVDDMELGAIQVYGISGNKKYLEDAVKFGKTEPVTPWMGADTAKHYQWYPFINLGHYFLAKDQVNYSSQFKQYMEKGINGVYEKGKNNPFLIGIPFIWCSNNLVAAILTQSKLYNEISGDSRYQEMEAALRDWLFGCNPWGTSMIIGLPEYGDYPEDPHSSIQIITKRRIDGGLVDGPIYSSIFNYLKGLNLSSPDEYADCQPGRIVYHDDYGDYSTNEPTMDGTASLTYYLSELQNEGMTAKTVSKLYEYEEGGIIRTDRTKKEIHLVFTGGDYGEGGEIIRRVLRNHKIKAMFFFTGDFYRNNKFAPVIYGLKNDGHYLGAHSDKHLLYSPWENRDSLLVTKEEFLNDLKNNYAEMEKFGVEKKNAKFFMPPYEWFNQKISDWCKEIGIQLINYSPGTSSNADYTTTDMKNYLSSEDIYKKILQYEANNKDGLNGFILLTHIGTHPDRTDKFYKKLDSLLAALKKRGYTFTVME